jgi:hypothetical protein
MPQMTRKIVNVTMKIVGDYHHQLQQSGDYMPAI